MEISGLFQAGVLVFVAFMTATAALLAAPVSLRRRGQADDAAGSDVAFLFDADTLVDATESGRRLLRYAPSRGSDMARLVAFLAPRFPELQARVRTCGEEDCLLVPSADATARLRLEAKAGRLRIALEDVGNGAGTERPDRHSTAVLAAELDAHREASDHAPVPVWRLDEHGTVCWANGAYWSLAQRAAKDGELGPGAFPVLFPELTESTPPPGTTQRLTLPLPGRAEPAHFEARVTITGRQRLISAVPADAAVKAERALREFIQTLTQTFAHLSVGLAIFDRRRELTLFNPALGDLLGVEVGFLIGRPGLTRFFDHLRERRMIPEPRDYKSWRQQMSELEAAAAGGGHNETWPLPDGRTFRITGRPHPDGAVAFLFEDISAEVTLGRSFREKLETGRAVIDTLDEAIAVFAADGRMSFANRAYARLWGEDGGGAGAATFLDASRGWQQACMPSPVWGDARDFAAEMAGRSSWTAEVRLQNGRAVVCRFEPLPGGGTMAGFAEMPAPLFRTRDSTGAAAASA